MAAKLIKTDAGDMDLDLAMSNVYQLPSGQWYDCYGGEHDTQAAAAEALMRFINKPKVMYISYS